MVDAEQNSIIQFPLIPCNKCDLCNKNSVEWKCLICDELMCSNCKTVHLRSKVSKNHKFVDLKGANVQPSEEIRKCTEHVTEDLQMFCKSCDIPVCRKCIASPSHNSHVIELVEDMVNSKKKELLDTTLKLKEKLDNFEQTVKYIGKNQREFSDKISKTIEEVKSRNNDMKDILNKITNDLIHQLQQLDKQDQEETTILERQLNVEIGELRHLIKQCENEQHNRCIDINQFVRELKQKESRYTTTGPPDKDSPPEFVTKNVEKEVKALFGNLVRMPSKSSQPTLPKQLARKRTGFLPYKEIKVGIIKIFSADGNTHVESTDDQAWVWRRSSKTLSLVTSDGQLLKNMDTDFQVYDITVIEDKNFLVTEWKLFGGKVHLFTVGETFTGLYATKFYRTTGMAVTDNGNAIIELYSGIGGKLVEITSTGEEIKTIQYDIVDKSKLFVDPCSISQNINGDIVVVDDGKKAVVVVSKNGRKKLIYDGKIGSLKKSFDPQSVVTDIHGHILVSDLANSVVHMLDKEGCFLKFLLSEDNGCNRPVGLSIDAYGRLWVVNTGSNSVMVVKYKCTLSDAL